MAENNVENGQTIGNSNGGMVRSGSKERRGSKELSIAVGGKRARGGSKELPKEEVQIKPNLWERFLAGDFPAGFGACGFICTLSGVLICVGLGTLGMKMSGVFGLYVLSDASTAAFFAHHQYLKDRDYWTDVWSPATISQRTPYSLGGASTAGNAQLIRQRTIPGPEINIFYEAKGTKCPGDDCNLNKESLMKPSVLKKIRDTETKIWNAAKYKNKYCNIWALGMGCRIPSSFLQMLTFGSTAATVSYQQVCPSGQCPSTFNVTQCLCQQSAFTGSSCSKCGTADCSVSTGATQVPSTCTDFESCSMTSPLDPLSCNYHQWTFADSTSQARASFLDLAQYNGEITKLCSSSTYWDSVRGMILPKFVCTNDHLKLRGTPFMRSFMSIGLPQKADTWNFNRDDEVDDLREDEGSNMLDMVVDVVKDVWGNEYGDDDVNVVVSSTYTDDAQEQNIQNMDLYMLTASFLYVFLYMWFNVESLFIALFGMLQIIFCVFPAMFIWWIINPAGLGWMQQMTFFLILGIGADDVFVLNDAFKQAKAELAAHGDFSVVDMFSVAYRRAFTAMLTTTLTTAWAFFFGVTNKIPMVRDFCVFAAFVVTIDFLMCITMFAASVAFQERFMSGRTCCCCGRKPQPGTCCAPGCCFGGTRIIYRKIMRLPQDASSDTRSLERFFAGPMFSFVNKYAVFFLIFWAFLLSGATVCACTIKRASKNPQGFPENHPVQRKRDITREYFSTQEPESIVVSFGFDKDEPVAKWKRDKGEEPEEMNFGNIDWAISTTGQQAILNLCKAPDTNGKRGMSDDFLIRGSTSTCAMDPYVHGGKTYSVLQDPMCMRGRYCIMELVRDYAEHVLGDVTQFPFSDFSSVVASSAFKNYVNGWRQACFTKLQHWNALNLVEAHGSGLTLDGNKVKYLWVTFNATFTGVFQTPEKGERIYDDWKAFVTGFIPEDKTHYIGLMFLFKVIQDILLQEALKNILVSLFVAYVVLSLITWNWYISLLGLINISCILLCFLGLWPVLDWELDIYNILFLLMCVGLSVDYTVHLLHAYNESPCETREARMREAFANMGITILSGATTTLLAAVPLFACTTILLARFGTFIFLTIFLSIVTAILLLTPLVLVVGPHGHFGDIYPFYWLQDKCKRRSSDKTAAKV